MNFMAYDVEVRQVQAQGIAVVTGPATAADLPRRIRALFDRFYAGFKSQGELNVVYYPSWDPEGEFQIQCGVLSESGKASLPAGSAATTVYFGPYDRMKPAHDAIHQWVRANGRRLAGPSWEIYGHWNEDPAKLRTDIFYLLG